MDRAMCLVLLCLLQVIVVYDFLMVWESRWQETVSWHLLVASRESTFWLILMAYALGLISGHFWWPQYVSEGKP